MQIGKGRKMDRWINRQKDRQMDTYIDRQMTANTDFLTFAS